MQTDLAITSAQIIRIVRRQIILSGDTLILDRHQPGGR
jgi:hypothetical protein